MRIGDGRLLQIFFHAAAAAFVGAFQFDGHARAVDHFFVAVVYGDPFDAVLFDVGLSLFRRREYRPLRRGRSRISGLLFLVLI